MTPNQVTRELSPPPDGVLRGESIPRENEVESVREARIERVMNALRIRGDPYLGMSEGELRERARSVLHKTRGDG